ncbi:MAG: hypothetical protein MUC92_05230, partial [Fimbriimonadaceae bacterium]|nr:hypothetical protein [Fimbriimonadaceae bacterium]
MMMRHALLPLALALTSFSFGQASTQPPTTLDPNRPVLIINGERVTTTTYYRRMETLGGVGRLVNDRFVPAAPGFLTLQTIMNEILLLQLAREKGVYPTEAEIDAQVKQAEAEAPEMLKDLLGTGVTPAEIRYIFTVNLAEFKLQTMGVNIANQEVDNFYRDNIVRYQVPKRFRLRIIAVKTEADQRKVDDELAKGKPFGTVAKELSQDLSRLNDGLFGEIPEGELGAARDVIISLRKGQSSRWLNSNETRVKFYVDDILEPFTIALDAKLRREIREELMVVRGRSRNNV